MLPTVHVAGIKKDRLNSNLELIRSASTPAERLACVVYAPCGCTFTLHNIINLNKVSLTSSFMVHSLAGGGSSVFGKFLEFLVIVAIFEKFIKIPRNSSKNLFFLKLLVSTPCTSLLFLIFHGCLIEFYDRLPLLLLFSSSFLVRAVHIIFILSFGLVLCILVEE